MRLNGQFVAIKKNIGIYLSSVHVILFKSKSFYLGVKFPTSLIGKIIMVVSP